jgi:nicotinic acid phosphoribosyltransferase
MTEPVTTEIPEFSYDAWVLEFKGTGLPIFDPSIIGSWANVDSYKMTHPFAYPGNIESMSAYIEARGSFKGDDEDPIIVNYGVRYFVERILNRPWKLSEISMARHFFSRFNVGGTPHPFPEDLFVSFIKENNGYFPVEVYALPDGSAILPRTPQLIIRASGKYARLVTWLETMAVEMIWYASTVATLSAKIKRKITAAFHTTVDEDALWKLNSRLHDFGARGTTVPEQQILGGAAHLLSFDGSDTVAACNYVQYWCNNGEPIGSSIPAMEHSTTTAWQTELEAVQNFVEEFGNGVFATVADSYDYENFLNVILPAVAPRVKELGGFHVIRPDSGDPVKCVLQGLEAAAKSYGYVINMRGYKVITGGAVIQGDGIDINILCQILDAVIAAGFSVENIAFGMGGALLQKVNRDTCRYACKLYLRIVNGVEEPVMKAPTTDMNKASMPGPFTVVWNEETYTYTVVNDDVNSADSEMQLVWNCGPIGPTGYSWPGFTDVRNHLEETSADLQTILAFKSQDGVKFSSWSVEYQQYREATRLAALQARS